MPPHHDESHEWAHEKPVRTTPVTPKRPKAHKSRHPACQGTQAHQSPYTEPTAMINSPVTVLNNRPVGQTTAPLPTHKKHRFIESQDR